MRKSQAGRPAKTLPFTLLLLLLLTSGLNGEGQKREYRNPFRKLSKETVEDVNGLFPAEKCAVVPRPAGLEGLCIAEISLAGIVSSADLYFALLSAANESIYIAKVGSSLFDGTVIEISENGITFAKTEDGAATVFKPIRKE
jgi:hypothetical protein